jgi:hypothetical protein
MHPHRGKSGHPFGRVGLKRAHVKPPGHVPPHVPPAVTTPHGNSGPVQLQLPLLSAVQALAFAHRPKQTGPKPQSGMPSVEVVNVGHGPLVLVVVVTVVEVQQKFTSGGASCISFRLQACRTLTLPLRVRRVRASHTGPRPLRLLKESSRASAWLRCAWSPPPA